MRDNAASEALQRFQAAAAKLNEALRRFEDGKTSDPQDVAVATAGPRAVFDSAKANLDAALALERERSSVRFARAMASFTVIIMIATVVQAFVAFVALRRDSAPAAKTDQPADVVPEPERKPALDKHFAPEPERRPALDKYCTTEVRPHAMFITAEPAPRGCVQLVSHRAPTEQDLESIARDRTIVETGQQRMPVPVFDALDRLDASGNDASALSQKEKASVRWWDIRQRKEMELKRAKSLDSVLTAEEKAKLGRDTEVREEVLFCCP